MKSSVEKPMQALFSYLTKYRQRLWFSVFSSIANKVLDLMPPLLVGWVVATISGHAPSWTAWFIDTNHTWSVAIFLAILAILIFGLESLTQWMTSYGFMSLAQNTQHDLRMTTYKHIQTREIAFFEKHRLGETMTMLNDDINQLERFLNTGFNDILQLGVLIVFAFSVLFYTCWQLALIGIIPLPLIIFGSFYFQKHIGPRYRQVRESVGELSSRLENNIGGMAVIKSFTAENYEYQRVERSSEQYRQANIYAIKLSTIFVPIIRMAIAVGFAGVLLMGSYWVLNGTHGLTVANLVVFSMLIQRVLWPFTRLGATLDEYERAKASARRTFTLLSSHSQIKIQENPERLNSIQGKIAFQNVFFHYDPTMPILKGLDLTIKSGEVVGIAGYSGAGKSTLVKLLLRFYDPSAGTIYFDNKELKTLSITELRQNISLVSQDVYLFHGSIRDNIAYGMSNIDNEDIIVAAKQAQLHDYVQQLKDGYDSMIGERGIKLSGGQRQRLSLARAILKNAPVIILDEATSSVDTETERLIQESLKHLTANKTAIIIAHRLSTIREADRILVLKDGRLIEQGKHAELLERGGSYADLWRIQTGELA